MRAGPLRYLVLYALWLGCVTCLSQNPYKASHGSVPCVLCTPSPVTRSWIYALSAVKSIC